MVIAMSESWLAKARVTGDGPPFSKVGRSIRYSPTALARWLKSRQHRSTSEYEKPRNRQIEDVEDRQHGEDADEEEADGREVSHEDGELVDNSEDDDAGCMG